MINRIKWVLLLTGNVGALIFLIVNRSYDFTEGVLPVSTSTLIFFYGVALVVTIYQTFKAFKKK